MSATDHQSDEVRAAVSDRADDVTVVLTELSTLFVDDLSVDQALRRVLDLACRTVEGCDAASVTLVHGDQPSTAVWTDERTLAVDTAQYEVGDGPCLDAHRRKAVNRVDLDEADDRWPAFVAAATDEGIKSFLAGALVVADVSLGALNLYSRSASGFGALDEAFIGMFTGQAAAALASATRYHDARTLAQQLEGAMASRAVIEQAKGVLMERHRVDADAAFGLLRVASQQRNVKLRLVAGEVVASAQDA